MLGLYSAASSAVVQMLKHFTPNPIIYMQTTVAGVDGALSGEEHALK